MGTAAKKKRAMRSRRSGVKKMTQIKANLAILKALALLLIVMLVGCVPVRRGHVINVNHHHNYYQKHRFNSYPSHIWIPGRGVILQNQPIPPQRYKQQSKRGKH